MKRKLIIKPIGNFARMIIVIFSQFILLITLINYANAQEITSNVVSSGGETLSASGISLDFVVGEIVTESFAEQGIILTQGFLQESEDELAISQHTINADDINIYPNPSSDLVYIVNSCLDEPLSVEVLDIHGCVVHSCKFTDSYMSVSLGQLSPGLYVFRIIFPDRNFITKRIIKK